MSYHGDVLSVEGRRFFPVIDFAKIIRECFVGQPCEKNCLGLVWENFIAVILRKVQSSCRFLTGRLDCDHLDAYQENAGFAPFSSCSSD